MNHRMRDIATLLLFLSAAHVLASPETTLERAWQNVDYLDYRRATREFLSIRKTAATGSDTWQQSTLGLALCLHQRQPDDKSDKARAAELYDELINSTDGVSIQATALLLRGKLAQQIDYFGDKEDFDAASRSYKRILQDWPNSTCAPQAALYLAQTATFRMQANVAADGCRTLETWLKAHPDNPYAAAQWMFLSLAYRAPLNDLNKAIDASIRAVETGIPREMAVDALYWRIASMAQKAGRKDTARDFYARIIEEVQRSRYTFAAQQRIKEMGFEPPPLVDPFADDE